MRLRRIYIFSVRLLPLCFIMLGVLNVILSMRRTTTDKTELRIMHDHFRTQIVEIVRDSASIMSNELRRVRRILFQYTYSTNVSPSFSTSFSSTTNYPSSYSFPLSLIEASYFVYDGRPYLNIGGFYYTNGDDFGAGPISFLSPLICRTSYGFVLQIKPPPSSTSESPVGNRVLFASTFDDTYPQVDLRSYIDRANEIEDSLNRNYRGVKNDTRTN